MSGNPENRHEEKAFKVGIVNFINTAPLLIPLKEDGPIDGITLLEDNPSRLNWLLEAGKIDMGLISSFSYGQHFKDYFILEDFCISATGTVGSVVLFSRMPIYELSEKTICLTSQSATSINLLYIILEHFNGLRPGYITGGLADFLEEKDLSAYLAIGDEALKIKNLEKGFYSYDLASIWYETTGLPFVFALWAIRRSSPLSRSPVLSRFRYRLERAYERGSSRLEEISSMVSARIPMSKVDCLAYLKGIEFDLSPLKLRGLKHFFRLLFQMGRLRDMPEINTVS